MHIYSENVVQRASTGELIVGPAEIKINEGLIVGVTPGRSGQSNANRDPDYEHLGEHLIAPAFVNAHTHLALASLRGLVTQENYRGNVVEEVYFRFETKLSAEDVRAFVRVAALECLLSGTATVWDHYYFADALVDAFRDVGLCAVIAPTLQDVDGPGVKVWEAQMDATIRIAQDPSLLNEGIVAALGPHATDTVSDALWTQVGEVATQSNLPVHAHVAQSQEELGRSWSKHGVPTLERLKRLGMLDLKPPFLMVHGLYVGRDELKYLDPNRHMLGFCPNAQMQFDFPAAVGMWREQEIPIVLGTDAACCNDTMNVQLELRNLAGGHLFGVPHSREYRSFSVDPSLLSSQRLRARRDALFAGGVQDSQPEALLSTLWSNPGSIHPNFKCGNIAPGHRANLVIYNTEHPAFWPGYNPIRSLAYSNVAPAIHGMMVNGQWKGIMGDFHRSIFASDDAVEFKLEADARLRGVLERAGLS